jgi:hypothetical protein
MSKVIKFDEFISEDIASFGAKMRRTVTGQSAGDEIDKLPVEDQEKLTELYRQNPTEAAKYLRSIIIREKNNQFGLGLALAVAGSALIYKAATFEPPKPDVKGDWVDFKPGEGETQFLNRQFGTDLGPDSKLSDFTDVVAQKMGNGSYEEGCRNLVAGLKTGGEQETVLSNLLKLQNVDPSEPLRDVFSGELAPHGGLAWGDLGGKVFIPDAK